MMIIRMVEKRDFQKASSSQSSAQQEENFMDNTYNQLLPEYDYYRISPVTDPQNSN